MSPLLCVLNSGCCAQNQKQHDCHLILDIYLKEETLIDPHFYTVSKLQGQIYVISQCIAEPN